MEPASKKVFVNTYGCQMTVYDSECMRDELAPLGYAETAAPVPVDLIVEGAAGFKAATLPIILHYGTPDPLS